MYYIGYVCDEYTFELLGKNKDMKQVVGFENSFLTINDIEKGFGKKIPLWLVGFLY